MSYETTSTEELLAIALGGDSAEEMLRAISDDLNVLWLAQQSDSLEPDELGFFLARLQARSDIAAELTRRASAAGGEERSNVVQIRPSGGG